MMAILDPEWMERERKRLEGVAKARRVEALVEAIPIMLEALEAIAKGRGRAAQTARAAMREVDEGIKAAMAEAPAGRRVRGKTSSAPPTVNER